jgi:hypothetical protein
MPARRIEIPARDRESSPQDSSPAGRGRCGVPGRIARVPGMKQRIADLGDAPLSLSTIGFAKLIVDETAKWGKVVRAANIRPE